MSESPLHFRWTFSQIQAWMTSSHDPYREFLQPLSRGHHLAVLGMLAHDPHPSATWLCEWAHYQLAEALLQQGRRCCARVHLIPLRSRYPKERAVQQLWQHCQHLPPEPGDPPVAPLPVAGRLRIVADPNVGDREFFRRLFHWQPPQGLEVALSAPERFRRLFQGRFTWLSSPSDWDTAPTLSLLQLPPNLPPFPTRPAIPRVQPGQPLRVGLVWSDGQGRGVGLNAFAPLAGLDGLQFHSLQKGPAALQARWPPPGMPLRDWSQRLPDWAATADLLQHIDLLLTVDSAVAYLALALGRPCWVLGRPPWPHLRKHLLKTFRSGQEFADRLPK
jgi:hypothetical protein